MQEHCGERYARQYAANNHRHEVLSRSKQLDRQPIGLLGHDGLHEGDEDSEQQNGVDGLHHELKSQDEQRHNEQQPVDDDVGVLHVEAGGIIDDGRHSGGSSCHNLIGHEEEYE